MAEAEPGFSGSRQTAASILEDSPDCAWEWLRAAQEGSSAYEICRLILECGRVKTKRRRFIDSTHPKERSGHAPVPTGPTWETSGRVDTRETNPRDDLTHRNLINGHGGSIDTFVWVRGGGTRVPQFIARR